MRWRYARAALAVACVVAVGVGGFALLYRRPAAPLVPREPDFTAQAVVGTLTPDGWVEREAAIASAEGERAVSVASGGATAAQAAAPIDARALADVYDVTVAPGPIVGGRPTIRTQVSRKGAATPAVVMDRDSETGAVLRRESYRIDGRLATRTELTSVEYGAPSAESVPAVGQTAEPEREMTAEEVALVAGFTPSEPSYVPEGYRRVGLYGYPGGQGRGRGYAEYRYTDGLRPLSVYERTPGGWGPGGPGGRGGGRGWGKGGPPETGRAQVADLGIALSARQRRGRIIAVVTGDITASDAVNVLDSIPPGQ